MFQGLESIRICYDQLQATPIDMLLGSGPKP